MKTYLPDIVSQTISSLSRNKDFVLEEAIVNRLDAVNQEVLLDVPKESNIKRDCRIIKAINQSISQQNQRLDKLFSDWF